jgi:hypothetical protein
MGATFDPAGGSGGFTRADANSSTRVRRGSATRRGAVQRPVSNTPTSTASVPAQLPNLDEHGRYRAVGELSYITIGVYVVLLLVLYFVVRPSPAVAYPWGIDAIIVITIFFLVRYLSTSYSIDDVHLRAWRIAGGRRIRLADVRKIEVVRLRDLSPTGFFGSWGWRGRMWSPLIGPFDAIYSDPTGLLVTADGVPLFISPRNMDQFARELSRRVRSYTGPLSVDAGAPASSF